MKHGVFTAVAFCALWGPLLHAWDEVPVGEVQIQLQRLDPVYEPSAFRNEGGKYRVSHRFVSTSNTKVIQGLFTEMKDEARVSDEALPFHNHSKIREEFRALGTEKMNRAIKLKNFNSQSIGDANLNGDWNVSVSKEELLRPFVNDEKSCLDSLRCLNMRRSF